MIKNTAIIFLLIAGSIGMLGTRHTQAHELKTDGSISALLHVNPEDDPVVNLPSEILFLINDGQKKFKLADCTCQATVKNNNEIIFSSALSTSESSYAGIFAPAIPYTFPHKGIYTITLTGEPKNQGGFQPFTISYDVRVEKQEPTRPQSEAIHIIYIIIAIGTGVGIIYLIKSFITHKSDINFPN